MTFNEKTEAKIARLVDTEGRPRKKPAQAKSISNDQSTQINVEGNAYFIDDQGHQRPNKRTRPRRRKTPQQRLEAGRPVRQDSDRRQMMLRRSTDWVDWTLDRAVRLAVPAILIAVVLFLER